VVRGKVVRGKVVRAMCPGYYPPRRLLRELALGTWQRTRWWRNRAWSPAGVMARPSWRAFREWIAEAQQAAGAGLCLAGCGKRHLADRSPENAAQVIDSAGALHRVFMAFGGPPRAMGHSLTIAAPNQPRGFPS